MTSACGGSPMAPAVQRFIRALLPTRQDSFKSEEVAHMAGVPCGEAGEVATACIAKGLLVRARGGRLHVTKLAMGLLEKLRADAPQAALEDLRLRTLTNTPEQRRRPVKETLDALEASAATQPRRRAPVATAAQLEKREVVAVRAKKYQELLKERARATMASKNVGEASVALKIGDDDGARKGYAVALAYEEQLGVYLGKPALKFLGNNPRAKNRNEDCWIRAAQHAESLLVSYETYVRAQFWSFDKWFSRHPKPYEIASHRTKVSRCLARSEGVNWEGMIGLSRGLLADVPDIGGGAGGIGDCEFFPADADSLGVDGTYAPHTAEEKED